ncbi:MAG: L-histidine N(alpha)-methyltransferase [Pseudomonadota bacterium]
MKPYISSNTLNNFFFYDDTHPREDDRLEIIRSLTSHPKFVSPKYFYDETGSQLFDQVCDLPEYYPTRTELALLDQFTDEIYECVGADTYLFEMGSGSSIKIRMLLDTLQPQTYLPIDISKEHLINAASNIAELYSWLTVKAICLDYSRPWNIPKDILQASRRNSGKNVVFFPGSSIGNFEPQHALHILKEIAKLIGHGGGLLIGVDVKKSTSILEAAYNDSQGITAQFNLNMLSHLNRLFDATFDTAAFEHRAFFNDEKSRIEMHLEAQQAMTVNLSRHNVHFKKGETIHTENSYKYSKEAFSKLCLQAGLALKKTWTDDKQLFNLYYFEKE